MTVVTAHQPNLLPGLNVMDKVDMADAVVWLDEVQFTKGGWTNRNRTPGDVWMTVPIVRETDGDAINRVKISDARDWRRKMGETLTQTWGGGVSPLVDEIMRPYASLVGLNAALLNIVMPIAAARTRQHWQSHLDGGHAVLAVSDSRPELRPISERLAMMVREVGGSMYLSGPSGRGYLDESPFDRLGIDVCYYEHHATNVCCASLFSHDRIAA